MHFLYSPQRDSNRRIDYEFEPLENRITIVYRFGKEILKRNRGSYDIVFQEQQHKKYVWNFYSQNDKCQSLPKDFLINHKITNGELYVTLLKPYGPEEEHNMAIIYPDWNIIHDYTTDKCASLRTSLSEFENIIISWSSQISEIMAQTHNMLINLSREYKNINFNNGNCPSPVSIRSFKTSIFTNSVLHIETIANFLSALAVNIDRQIIGAPTSISKLSSEDIDKLNEKNRNYLRLEDKIVFSLHCISKLIGIAVEIDKGNHIWGRFKEFKKKRDSLTHVKIIENKVLSLSQMVGAVKITDNEIYLSVELICWINEVLNNTLQAFELKTTTTLKNFNDHLVIKMIRLAEEISGIKNSELYKKYKIDTFCVS